MTIAEVERYYGAQAAAWVREQVAAGRFKPPAVTCRLRNPKCIRTFLRMGDVVDIDGAVALPDEVRFSDTVQVEIPGGEE